MKPVNAVAQTRKRVSKKVAGALKGAKMQGSKARKRSKPLVSREKDMLTKKQWTLIALALAEGKALTPVQLQKAVFLLGRKLPGDVVPHDFYNFVPYNYGPFDSAVYDDAQTLAREGMATVALDYDNRYQVYAASDEGVQAGEALLHQLPDSTRDYAKTLIDWVRKQSFSGLVNAIYKAYPEFRVNSVFKG